MTERFIENGNQLKKVVYELQKKFQFLNKFIRYFTSKSLGLKKISFFIIS